MKKMMFVAAMAAMVFSACSKEETVNDATRAAIKIDSYIGKTTKGAPVSNADFNKAGSTMKIWGYMTAAEVTTTLSGTAITGLSGVTATRDADGKWSYGTTAYWQKDMKHHFFAFAPADAAGCDIDAAGLATIAVAGTVADQKDILLAEPKINKEYAENPAMIQFYLRHALSQVKFTLKFKDEVAAEVKDLAIESVVFKPETSKFSSKNTMKMLGQTYSDSDHSTAFDYVGAATANDVTNYTIIPSVKAVTYDVAKQVFDGTDGVAMILPQALAEKLVVEINLSYNDKDGAAKTATITRKTAANIDWQINKVYNYNMEISVVYDVLGYRDIVIGDPTVGEWDTTEGGETIN